MPTLSRRSRYSPVPQMLRTVYLDVSEGEASDTRVDRVISTRYTSWKATPDTAEYVAKPGDTFHTLALSLYGDAKLWWVIADFNYKTVPNPLVLEPNTVIFLPPARLVNAVPSRV